MKKPKTDMHSHPADHPDSPASILIFTPCIHLVRMNLAKSGSDLFIGVNRLVDLVVSQFIFVCCLVVNRRTTFFLRWLALDRGYIKSHSAYLDDPFNPSQFQKCHLPSRIISNTQLK
ncbi:hypothetical protein YC2023_010891 [Brassica napus]